VGKRPKTEIKSRPSSINHGFFSIPPFYLAGSFGSPDWTTTSLGTSEKIYNTRETKKG